MKQRKFSNPTGLRLKLFLAMTAIVVLALSMVTLVSTILMRSTGKTITRDDVVLWGEAMREWAGSIVMNDRSVLDIPDSVDAQSVMVLDAALDVVYPFAGESELRALVGPEVLRVVLRGYSATQTRSLELFGGDTILHSMPLRDMNNHPVGVLVVAMPTAAARAISEETVIIMIIAMAVALFISVLINLLAAGNLTAPLTELLNALRNFTAGDYSVRSHVQGRDEIAQIAGEFDRVGERLSATIQQTANEKQRLVEVMEGISEGIIAIDGSGSVIRVNPAAYSLLRVPLGREEELMNTLGATDVLRQMALTAQDQVRRAARYEIGGMEQEAAISAVRSVEGEPMGAVCVLRDISAAERMEKIRRDYVANISHEFRAPITGIRGFVEPLMDGLIEDAQERDECYRIIYNETLRLERLISETLDLSRLQSQRFEMEMEIMQLNDLTAAVVNRFQERAKQQRIHLSFVAETDSPAVKANADRVDQLLVILLDNALKFTPPNGSVRVCIAHSPNEVLLQVQDTGSGIAEEDLPYVFERFFKGDKSRSAGGTGLGLSIAREIATLLHGHLEVESTVGEGTLFTLCLPIYEETT